MQRGVVFGRELEMSGSPLTLLIFREEFDEGLPKYLAYLAQKAAEEMDPEEFLRVAWAMARTYDSDVQRYEEWLDEFPDEAFYLGEGSVECISVITSAIDAELFRQKTTLFGRIRGFIKRFFRRVRRWFRG